MPYPPTTADVDLGLGDWVDLPLVRTPMSRFGEHWITLQRGPCRDFEMDYTRCAAAVGHIRARQECNSYMQDMLECSQKIKQFKRYQIIQAERAKRKEYEKPPVKDSIYNSPKIY